MGIDVSRSEGQVMFMHRRRWLTLHRCELDPSSPPRGAGERPAGGPSTQLCLTSAVFYAYAAVTAAGSHLVIATKGELA